MRRVYVIARVKIQINAKEGTDITDVLDEMDYNFYSETEGADIVDTEILDYDIEDSK